MEGGLSTLAEVCARAKVGPVLRDFCGRRSALIKALTDDFDEFFDKCDPNGEELCLYGDANGQWRVAPPPEDIPPQLPEPALGINFARDGMSRDDWLKKMLHKKIEQLPKILELVAIIHRNARAQLEQIFMDFCARRRALIRALTEDADDFYRQCRPVGILCLFGETNRQWRVAPPAQNVPQNLPQPVRGINLFRDSMPRERWLSRVAHYSDTWLRSLTSFEADNIGLHQADRQRLLDMVDEQTTIYQVVESSF